MCYWMLLMFFQYSEKWNLNWGYYSDCRLIKVNRVMLCAMSDVSFKRPRLQGFKHLPRFFPWCRAFVHICVIWQLWWQRLITVKSFSRCSFFAQILWFELCVVLKSQSSHCIHIIMCIKIIYVIFWPRWKLFRKIAWAP